MFDSKLAQRIAERHDRDAAPYFSGRAKEIEAFEVAVRNAGEDTAAVFRIYQGAPGCGKTSLANHLKDACENRALVVSFSHDEEFNREALARKVRNQVISRSRISKALAAIGEFAATTLRNQALSEEAQRDYARYKLKDECLVVHIDEAHAMPDGFKPTLAGLHVGRPGVPCVVVLTGLGHTARVVTDHAVLSRLANDAVVEMGAMSAGECAESTSKMLDALRVHGTVAEQTRLAELTADLAFGWPQHLNIAQTAVCKELIRTRGEARSIRTDIVQDETALGRARYYAGRLDHHPMTRYPLMARRIVAELKTAAVSVEGPALEDFCERTVREHDPQNRLRMDRQTLEAIAGQLERRGVVARRNNCWRLAIPSMGDWAAEALEETAARQRRSISSIIEESLRLRGTRTYESALEIVERSRARKQERSRLEPDEALALAVREVRQLRREKSA